MPERQTKWRAVSALALMLGLSFCGGEGTTSPPTNNNPPATVSVASVTITAPGGSIVAGATMQATATVRDASNNTLTGRSVSWSSSNSLVAIVSSDGLIAGVTAGGPVTITATSEGKSGTMAVTVVAPAVVTQTLSVSLSGTGTGSVTSTPAGIACSTPNTGTCSASFAAGAAVSLAAAPTSTSTFAGWGGVCTGTGSCTVTMDQARAVSAAFATITVVSVSIAPQTLNLGVGGSAGTLTASVVNSAGPVASPSVTWTSSNAGIATVSGTGAAATVTPVAAGSATITATSGGVTGTATVTVVAAALPVVTVVATDPNASEVGADPGTFTITRTGATTAALSVNIALSGTATNGTDYTTVAAVATIPAGQTSASVQVLPLADALTEGAETVILTLANGSYTIGTPNTATVTIADAVSAAPGTLVDGRTHNGTISIAGTLDRWTFTATQGDYIAIGVGTATQTTAHFAPWIQLISPTGVKLAESFTQTGASQIAVNAPASGTYTVIVASYLGGFTDGLGSYRLTLAKGPGAVEVSAGDEGGPMANGATNAGTIYQGDFDTWTFTATQGDYIALSVGTVTETTAHFAPWIRLVSPTGVLLGDNFTQTGASQIAVNAPATGTYTVIVGSYSGGYYDGTGSYLLTLANGSGSLVAVSTGDEGGPMSNGGTHAGAIYQGDFDTWTFTAAQGDFIALSVGTGTQATSHYAPWIRLVSPTGVLLGSNFTQTGASQIGVNAPASGTYTVIIGSYSGGYYDGVGNYLLTLGKGPGTVAVSTGDEGGPMVNGATNAGTIYQGDFDTWTFTATQGDYIALSVGMGTQGNAHFAPWIRLVSPTGVLLGNNFTQTGASQIAVNAPTTGTYTVIIASYSGGYYDGIGNYVLTLAQGPGTVAVSTGDEGGPMVNGATNAGTIYQGDFDTWTFTATQGDYIALSVGMGTQGNAHFAPWIRLVSPTGVLLGNNFTQTGASQIAVNAPTTGTYTVIIGSYSGGYYDGAGNYLLTLAKGPGAVVVSTGDQGGPMANGANAGAIYQGDFDTWTFTATQGDHLTLTAATVTQTSSHFAPWIRLVSPTGVVLGNSSPGTATSSIAVTAPASGTYTVIIGSYSAGYYDGIGSYSLTRSP